MFKSSLAAKRAEFNNNMYTNRQEVKLQLMYKAKTGEIDFSLSYQDLIRFELSGFNCVSKHTFKKVNS